MRKRKKEREEKERRRGKPRKRLSSIENELNGYQMGGGWEDGQGGDGIKEYSYRDEEIRLRYPSA